MPNVFLLQENVSTWAGRDITPTLLSHAWRIRSILYRTKSAIFQGRPQCLCRSLFTEQTYTILYRFLGTHTLYATRQTFITTNRQIVRTPNLNEANIWRSRWDLNPRACSTPSGFQDRPLKPLGYCSMLEEKGGCSAMPFPSPFTVSPRKAITCCCGRNWRFGLESNQR